MDNLNRKDRIFDKDGDGRIIIPVAHYAIVKIDNDVKDLNTKFVIYGLGSCIALILYDSINKIYGMSHILLPHYDKKKDLNFERFPHKYADLSVRNLLKEIIRKGGVKKYIQAAIIGGSQIFRDENNPIGLENIKSAKDELQGLKIDICMEEIGGHSGRLLIYEVEKNTILLKKSSDFNFQKYELNKYEEKRREDLFCKNFS